MVSDNGLEVLVHIGLDTVSLEGKPFEVKVTEGQTVAAGDLLVEADLAAIREAGKLGIEGKDYVVQDGDIMHFRFNV